MAKPNYQFEKRKKDLEKKKKQDEKRQRKAEKAAAKARGEVVPDDPLDAEESDDKPEED